MAKLFDGKKLFASAIKPTGGQPLDDRTVVSLHSDLTNASTFVVNGSSAAYKGMLVAVVEDQQVYMLVDETNITSEESWVAVGSGNGSLAVDTYGEAVALATDDNIGQIIYVKTTSDYDADGEGEGAAVEYSAAPYIVIGNGQLQKLAASTASGDLDADVAELQTKVSSIETKIGAAAEAEKAATGLYKEIADAKDAALTDAKAYTNEREVEIDKKWAAADEQVLADAKADATAQIEALDLANTYDAKGAAEAAQSAAIAKAEELDEAMDARVKALEDIDHDHENKEVLDGITAGKVASWDAAEQNAKDYADQTFVTKDGFNEFESEYEEKLNNIAEGAQVNVIEAIKVNGIDAEVSEGKVAEVKVDAKDIELGVDITGSTKQEDGTFVTGTTFSGETKLSTVLQSIQDSIRAAVAGGVNSVTSADDIIEVNNVDSNNPKVSLKVEEATDETVKAGHIEMIKGENGLYGMMYYDGDDSEVSA